MEPSFILGSLTYGLNKNMTGKLNLLIAGIQMVSNPIGSIVTVQNSTKISLGLNEYNAKQIGQRLSQNYEVKNSIQKVELGKFTDYSNDLKELNKLSLLKIEKKFMKKNLDEKYQIKLMKNINTRQNTYLTYRWNNYSNYLKTPDGKNAVGLNGYDISFKGPRYNMPTWDIHDFAFYDDVSYMNWNNQTILNNMLISIKNKEKNIDNMINNVSSFDDRKFQNYKDELEILKNSLGIKIDDWNILKNLKRYNENKNYLNKNLVTGVINKIKKED